MLRIVPQIGVIGSKCFHKIRPRFLIKHSSTKDAGISLSAMIRPSIVVKDPIFACIGMLGSTTVCFKLLTTSSQRSQLQAEAPELLLRLQTVLFDSSVCGVPGAKVASNPGQQSDSDFDSDSVSDSESFRLGPKVPLALLFTNGGGGSARTVRHMKN